MQGHVKISKERINHFFQNQHVPAEVQSEIGHGGYGVVFQGLLNHLPVVIKVALCKTDERHTLALETDMYKQLGFFSDLDTSRTYKSTDPVGVAYYYGSEIVDKHENLCWKKDHIKKHIELNKYRPRPRDCQEHAQPCQQSSQRTALFGLCSHSSCKACEKNKLELHVMILSQFGPSIRDIIKEDKSKPVQLSVQTVSKMLLTALTKIKMIHDKGLVHLDIKPNNMVIPSEPSDARFANFYFIDLGLSKSWRDENGHHIEHSQRNSYTGTIYWIGADANDGHEASRRDDIQALAIVGLHCLLGDLPWRKVEQEYSQCLKKFSHSSYTKAKKVKKDRNKALVSAKIDFIKDVRRHTKHLPPEFGDFLVYAHNLGFKDTPNYAYWMQKFHNLVRSLNKKDTLVDWHEYLNPVDSSSSCIVRRPSYSTSGSDRGYARSHHSHQSHGSRPSHSSHSKSKRCSRRRHHKPHHVPKVNPVVPYNPVITMFQSLFCTKDGYGPCY